ncbi:MAG: hypothetical protein ACTSO9_09815 [Candidatus Helarchaeota archaeon]
MTSERKTVAINKSIADKLSEIAKKEGMTLFSLINEVLEAEIFAHDAKLGRCSKIVHTYQNFSIIKDIGMSFIPYKLLNVINKHAFQTEGKDEIIQEWYKYGQWLANYTKIRFPNKEIETIEEVSRNIFWQKTEFQIIKRPSEKNPREVELRIFGQQLEFEYMECISSVYEGIFHELNFKTVKKDVSEGIAHIKFSI